MTVAEDHAALLARPDLYAIKANFAEPRSPVRTTASAWIINENPGWSGQRVCVWARSRGGRMIKTWIATKRLANFRAKWAPPAVRQVVYVLYETKEEAQQAAARIARWSADAGPPCGSREAERRWLQLRDAGK